jgi:hypothetical protein
MSISERAQKLCEVKAFGEWMRERYGYTLEYALTQLNVTVIDSKALLRVLCMLCEAACPGELDQTPVCIRKFLAIEEAYQKGRSQ